MTDKEFVLSVYSNARLIEIKPFNDILFKVICVDVSLLTTSQSFNHKAGSLSDEQAWNVARINIEQTFLQRLIK